ncbi:MAG TPA: DUF2493 domain-containing protein [Phenylobacterium sp.]|nr:DUF2493 domain-containing protein [Phenylobacterium sp.]
MSLFFDPATNAGVQLPTRPQPEPGALEQLGQALMTETLDVIGDTALEDFQTAIAEGLIGAFQSIALRLQREWDRAADEVKRLTRDFDGSEVADVELQDAVARAQAAEAAIQAIELVRDRASETYTAATGEVWTPWRGSVRRSACTAAQLDAREALRAKRARDQGLADPGATVVAFRGAPKADTGVDAGRVFDALNWALGQWPDMKVATTGLVGPERLALSWARQKQVDVILAKPDFDRHRAAAPFRANETLLALEPVLVLTLPQSVDPERAAAHPSFGPALNLGQKAEQAGIRHIALRSARPR